MRSACVGRNSAAHVFGFLILCFSVAAFGSAVAQTALPDAPHSVGMTQVEFKDPANASRTLDFMLIYPASPKADAPVFRVMLSSNLHLYKDAPFVSDGLKHPLIVFSHGAGGNASGYAWFGESLASHGYIVALLYHYRANTFDSSALYVRSRLWQRPRDVSIDITHLLHDPKWGPRIDSNQIGVAGHSQGGFTALWIGGAMVNPDLFMRFQRAWKTNENVPEFLRAQMEPDARPALHVSDKRVKAVFAMAPGDIQGFGMDAAGLHQMAVPAYILVGAGDTTTPPKDNPEFAATNIAHATLDVMPGPVGHEIFGNECDQTGLENYPEACVDAPGVDRAKLHEYIGNAALKFFDQNLGVRRQSAN